MQDDYFGHRDPVTGDVAGGKTEWTSQDFALLTAHGIIEAYTNQHGIPKWHLEDPAVNIDAVRKIDEFNEAIERKTKAKNYKAQPGEYFVADVSSTRSDGSLWSYLDWVKAESEKVLDGKIE